MKQRVLVLMHEDLVPPEGGKGYSEEKHVPWKTEFDVMEGLARLGHDVRPLGVHADLALIRRTITEWKPHVVFNLLEEFHEVEVYDSHIVSYLELLKQHYTGCNPRGLLLAHDKALSKKILNYHRIRVPRFGVFMMGRKISRPPRTRYPMFVKSLTEEGSFNLAQASVVHNDEKLKERVAYLHEKNTHVIAEEYILGRELYIGVLGNRRLQTLPILEMVFENLAEGSQPIATTKVKWDWEYSKKRGIDVVVARNISDDLEKRIQRVGKRVFRLLGLSGYARIDLRLTEEGEIYVLEANPNPDLGYGEELCIAAEAAGLGYDGLLAKILGLGRSYEAEWRKMEI